MENKKVLIVEDDQAIIKPMVLLFGKKRIATLTAANAEEGLLIAYRDAPDLILLDILMPKIDGFMMLEKLKSDEKTKNIPVFIISNLGSDEKIKRGMELGAKKYFIKTNWSLSDIVKSTEEELASHS
ncbi:MAG: response regulator [Parcubacteria group bacterium]|nr:response regulator [Parcubacteria group bacterium]